MVDDDHYSLNLYGKKIKTLGLRDVHLISTASECLERLGEKPQLIFLDYYLDEVSGSEVLKKIKCLDPTLHVVMVSGQSDVEIILEALRFGAFDYLIKGEGEMEKMGNLIRKIRKIRSKFIQNNPSVSGE